MRRRGILVVISGFAGTGKGTIVNTLLNRYDNYALSVSATTRAPRPGEQEGVHYFYKSGEEFEKMIARGQLIEYAQYVGNYYGTPREYVETKLEEGRDVILEIEIQGALKIKAQFPDTLLLFVAPPGAAALKSRLEGRGTETPDVIRERLGRAVEEAEVMDLYDYVVVNDEIDACVKEVHGIIQSEHCRAQRNEEFIQRLRRDLEQFRLPCRESE